MASLENTLESMEPNGLKRNVPNDFDKTLHTILRDISVILKEEPQNSLNSWMMSVVQYNVPYGKKIRGKLVETAYSILSGQTEGTRVQQARILGWCVEILQAAFLVVDDLMDNGTTRRGQPCWYRVNNMGNIVANDGLLLENLVYQIIKQHFGSSKLYVDLLDLILGVSFNTMLGQSLDTRYSVRDDKNIYFDQSAMQLYYSIATLKTSYYTIYLPIALAMVLADFGNVDECNHKHLWKGFKEIALKIGIFFQIQDDYFDCFSDKEKMGKEGSDIQEGKCSWLFAKAMELSDEQQKKILLVNYGMNVSGNVSRVKKLYMELNLPNEYLKIQKEMTAEILGLINKLEHTKLQNVLNKTFTQIFQRVR